MLRICVFAPDTEEIHLWKTKQEAEHGGSIKLILSHTDDNLDALINEHNPTSYVTINPEGWSMYKNLAYSSASIRTRWIHYSDISNFNVGSIRHAYIETVFNKDTLNPLISIFTPAYKSQHRIQRPFRSLRSQTYKNWEWVIVDDSDDGDVTLNQLKELEKQDSRIRVYKTKHSGIIGAVKRDAAMLCRGEYLVELDHDDDLIHTALEDIKNSFDRLGDRKEEVGMLVSYCSEVFEENLTSYHYGNIWGMGYGSYYKEFCFMFNKWLDVAVNPLLNATTMSHIVAVPNHVRVWTSKAYRDLNGHNKDLWVADDYDLIVRTFLKYRIATIPKLLYIQYRNSGSNNFTFIRNGAIQELTQDVYNKNHQEINKRCIELGISDKRHNHNDVLYLRDFKTLESVDMFISSGTEVSIVIPTYNRADLLKRAIRSVCAQDYTDWKIYLIGDKCPTMEKTIEQLTAEQPMLLSKLRWWNLPENHGAGGAVPRNYAIRGCIHTDLIAFLDDDNYWLPNHLSTLVEAINKPTEDGEKYMYAFSSFRIDETDMEGKLWDIRCVKPVKGRIDTSCLLFRKELTDKYGDWKDRNQGGYSHDFELVSRWKDEKYIPTDKITMVYNTDTNGQSGEELYNWNPEQNLIN